MNLMMIDWVEMEYQSLSVPTCHLLEVNYWILIHGLGKNESSLDSGDDKSYLSL